MPSWIQDPETHELIPKEEYYARQNSTVYVHGDIEPFISPVTGELISDRGQLRRHNAKHGVTDSRDYSPEFLHKRRLEREAELTGTSPKQREERRQAINEILKSRGY